MQITSTTMTFANEIVPEGTMLAGYAALVNTLNVEVPLRSMSCISSDHVRGSMRQDGNWNIYDKRYWPGSSLGDHLTFAMKHEPLDLLILKRVLEAVPEEELAEFVQSIPMGGVTRRIWFFYETLTGRRLNIPDAKQGPAVDALDQKKYFTGNALLSRRHRVRNNLLGDGFFCPVIRRTEKLEEYLAMKLDEKAGQITGRVRKHLLTRAASFMLLADSRASFEIEGERPPRNRLERWGKAVLQAGKKPLQLAEIVRLHGVLIEDSRFVQIGLRSDGVFLGERDHNEDPLPEFIGARPDNLEALLEGLFCANSRMRESGIDAVLQAAATAFGFVYIHPLQDGNGRVHRCLIHHVLAERKFTPSGMVFPVSSVMLDRIEDYQNVLQSHTGPLMGFVEWRSTVNRNIEVKNETVDLYRYYDCTDVAEFLYACVKRTVEEDLPREIVYLQRYDEAIRRIMNFVEMPDRLAGDFIMFVRQNEGTLPKSRRKREFEALTDSELSDLEAIVQDAFHDS
jgi:hypothetical protein